MALYYRDSGFNAVFNDRGGRIKKAENGHLNYFEQIGLVKKSGKRYRLIIKPLEKFSRGEETFGPFHIADTADNLPVDIRKDLLERSIIEIFRYPRLIGELFDKDER